jgi:netrin 1
MLKLYKAFWLIKLLLVSSVILQIDNSDDTILIDNDITDQLSASSNEYPQQSSISYALSDNVKEKDDDPCYDKLTGQAQRCIPNFENVAFDKIVQASSTCGQTPMTYCVQSSGLNRNFRSSMGGSAGSYCDKCDENVASSVRDSKYLTDAEANNSTCWVSAPIFDPTQTSNLTLQISFGKKYELTYISLQFCTSLKPDSLAIMKSMDYGKTWIPFQFYSSECKKVFNRPLKAKITQANEQEAICTDSHLQSSPFNTNRIGFSTLEGRPSFHEFDTSPVLQDWVTATDIKIVFNRLVSPVVFTNNNNYQIMTNNTRTLKRKLNSRHSRSQFYTQMQNLGYYYAAVSELAIGGRCKCNGHASRCILNKLVHFVFIKFKLV